MTPTDKLTRGSRWARFRKLVRESFHVIGVEVSRHHPDWAALGHIEKPDLIIDVGVGNGTPVLYEAFPDAYLCLVEPVSNFHDVIERKILARRPGELLRFAAGSQRNDTELTFEHRYPTMSSILERAESLRVDGKKSIIKVPMERLDAMLDVDRLQGTVLLKIDTEGFELEVLKGAEGIVSGLDYIIVECNLRRRFLQSYSLDDLIAWMNGAGFSFESLLTAVRDRDGEYSFADILFSRRPSR